MLFPEKKGVGPTPLAISDKPRWVMCFFWINGPQLWLWRTSTSFDRKIHLLLHAGSRAPHRNSCRTFLHLCVQESIHFRRKSGPAAAYSVAFKSTLRSKWWQLDHMQRLGESCTITTGSHPKFGCSSRTTVGTLCVSLLLNFESLQWKICECLTDGNLWGPQLSLHAIAVRNFESLHAIAFVKGWETQPSLCCYTLLGVS